MKKLYMTKKRERILHEALSIDNLLYRKFDQMQQRIDDYALHLKKTYKNVIQVKRIRNEVVYIEQIVDIQKIDGEGLVITIT